MLESYKNNIVCGAITNCVLLVTEKNTIFSKWSFLYVIPFITITQQLYIVKSVSSALIPLHILCTIWDDAYVIGNVFYILRLTV